MATLHTLPTKRPVIYRNFGASGKIHPKDDFLASVARKKFTPAGMIQRDIGTPHVVRGRGLETRAISINLFTNSEFQTTDNVAYSSASGTLIAKDQGAPCESPTVLKLSRNSKNARLIRNVQTSTVLTSGKITACASFSVKATETSSKAFIGYTFDGYDGNPYPRAEFNLANGTIETVFTPEGATYKVLAGIESQGNGWWRISLGLFFTEASTVEILNVNLYPDSYRGIIENTNTNTAILVTASQMNRAPAPTQYIPTTTSSVRSESEYITIPCESITGKTGTVLVDYELLGFLGSDCSIVDISDESGVDQNDTISFFLNYPNNILYLRKRKNRTDFIAKKTTASPHPLNTPSRLILRWDENGADAVVKIKDEIHTVTLTAPDVENITKIKLGYRGNNNNVLDALFKLVIAYDYRLSDSEIGNYL